MENEMISVIMAVYNCADTLPAAIDSILKQTYRDFEFIICDDCSTDTTPQVLAEYAARDSRIVLLRNEKNSRLPFSLNHCLQYAKGKYVARMDGDDLSVPERFEKQIDFLKAHPECHLIGTAMQQFNEKGNLGIEAKPETLDKFYMRRDVPFNHATIMTYRSVYEALNGYTVSERTIRGQDYDLWFRFFHAGYAGANLPEALYLVREDMNAIKRRTFKVRWNTFKTTRFGFNLLGFPKWWLIKPFCTVIFKSLVPYKAIGWYRNYQKRAQEKRAGVAA